MYQDLRVPGMGEDFYRSAQDKRRDLHQGQGQQGQRRR
jgi:hypothetical protein